MNCVESYQSIKSTVWHDAIALVAKPCQTDKKTAFTSLRPFESQSNFETSGQLNDIICIVVN